jgi:hypothetical protein
MLKITIQEEDRVSKLKLEGRLAGPWIDELERSWGSLPKSRQQSLVVDLTDVTFIERDGKALLTRMWKEGADLIATGCCTKSIVEDITGGNRRAPSDRSGTTPRSEGTSGSSQPARIRARR